jgi:hypothetical protein
MNGEWLGRPFFSKDVTARVQHCNDDNTTCVLAFSEIGSLVEKSVAGGRAVASRENYYGMDSRY